MRRAYPLRGGLPAALETIGDVPLLRALPYAIAFVDHTPTRRMTDIQWLAARAQVLVVHDTESKDYGYEKINGLFRYQRTDRDRHPWTTVFSNFIDVTAWPF